MIVQGSVSSLSWPTWK